MIYYCPICGKPMDKFDYELFGGHRECLIKKEEEDGESTSKTNQSDN